MSQSPIDFVLSKLSNVKKEGQGWKAICPCHADTERSLSIKVGEEEKVLLHCHAGCSTPEIVEAMGAHMKDLFVQHSQPSLSSHPYFSVEEIYEYVNEQGELLFQICRTSDKKFPIRRKDEGGNWVWNLGNQPRVLYRLPELQEAVKEGKIILIVEGEKDVNRLFKEGFHATTSPLGASKWRENYNSYFKDAIAFILPDNDKAGKKHAEQIRANLSGIAACVEIIELPHLKKGEDVSDWLDQYGNKEDLQKLLRTPDKSEEWKKELLFRLDRSGQKKLLGQLANVVTILGHSPEWQGVLAYNEFLETVVSLAKPPWHPHDTPETPYISGQIFGEEDFFRTTSWLSRYWHLNVSLSTVAQAIRLCARKHHFHPVHEYLEGFVWDQKQRLSDWLTRYLGAEDNDYTKFVGEWWMISAIARIMAPGCKVDHVLILEGKQGIQKSSALEILAGEWFIDTPFTLGSKDGYLALRGRWIIELAELESLTRSQANRTKAFFTSRRDIYRPPYAREAQTFPRQCVFAGTVNDSTYLDDPTGGRRYWPVACSKVDLDGLTSVRDQLWAEALWLYKEGAAWWPENEYQRKLCASRQSDRYQQDAWEYILLDWIQGRKEPNSPVALSDLLGKALKLEVSKWDKRLQTRVGKCMTRLGWTKHRQWNKERTKKQAFYLPPQQDPFQENDAFHLHHMSQKNREDILN